VTLFSRAGAWLKKAFTLVASSRGWISLVQEPWAGAWQRNLEINRDLVISFSAVYACVTLIASDIAKMRLRLVEQLGGVWKEVDRNSPFWPVLRKPNHFQNRLKFIENWVTSKLLHGNAYILKQRDNRGVVTKLYVLDPNRVKVLVSDEGSVFYELQSDNIAGLTAGVVVPSSEIIHDTMVCLFHPLIGVSPIYACGLAATQGLKMQENSALFFQNMSRPGGVLTAPAHIGDDTAQRLKAYWDDNFSGAKAGKVAVLGDGLKYEAMTITAVDSQMVEQLKWTREDVCTAFHMPPWKIGVGQMPAYGNSEIGNQIYYSDCLQSIIESIELHLDEGLGLENVQNRVLGTEFNLHDLLRMDTAARYRTWGEGIKAGFLAPNEARGYEDLADVAGGDSPVMQQQNYSLAALAKRDAREDPFSPAKAETPPTEPVDDEEAEAAEEAVKRAIDARVAPLERALSELPAQLVKALQPPADEFSMEDFTQALTDGLQQAA
jgi:HK97 family phage portal protein